VRLVHDPAAGDPRTLTADVERATTFRGRARGLMFRRSFPGALAFEFDRVGWRGLHMLFVRAPIDAVWVSDGEVTQVSRLRPWRGVGLARADLVVETPAGGAAGVRVGDGLRLAESTDNL
jgi:uncharacterized membrane protein (UPF0127 family)